MTSTEQPDVGWRLPTTTPARRETQAHLLAGLFAAGGMSWVTTMAVGNAWSACDDLGLGGGFLLVVFFPGLTLVALAGFAIGSLPTIRARSAIRFAGGITLSLAICLAAASLEVPAYGEQSDWYTADADLPECGSNGIPTWWPTWLPS